MYKVGLKGKVIIFGVLPLYILHNNPLLSLQVKSLKVTDLVAPEANPDGLRPVPHHDPNDRLALTVGSVGGLLFDVLDEPYDVDIVAVCFLLHEVVPLVAVQGELSRELLVVDLDYFVLFVFKADLRAVVF